MSTVAGGPGSASNATGDASEGNSPKKRDCNAHCHSLNFGIVRIKVSDADMQGLDDDTKRYADTRGDSHRQAELSAKPQDGPFCVHQGVPWFSPRTHFDRLVQIPQLFADYSAFILNCVCW